MVKKLIDISQGFYKFRFLLHRYFFDFLWRLPVYLVGYAKCMLYSEQSNEFLTRRHLNRMLLTNFENLNSIPKIPRNTRFLSFDGPSNYLYLFKNHQQRVSWPGELSSSHIKVTKVWFGSPNIKYLSEPFFADFCCRKGVSC